MEEVIKYFESLEARIAAYEARIAALEEAQQTNEAVIASLEAEVEELKNRQPLEPQVIEKVVEKIVEKPVEVIKEVVVEKPVVVAAPEVPEELSIQETAEVPETPAIPETQEESAQEPTSQEKPVAEEPVSPKAAIYGKAVDDIRLAISLGDRFLYQRELFGQNAELMQRTLTELNELNSFDEAINYISSRFQWDTESNTYQQFLVTLHRRFG